MKNDMLSNQLPKALRESRMPDESEQLAIEELVEMGKEFAIMCETVSDYAKKQNMKPKNLVKEIFYSALLYKEFLDKYLP